MAEQATIHGYLEIKQGPAAGMVTLMLPESVTRGGLGVVLSHAQAWNLVARLIVALEGTNHLTPEQCAALWSAFR